MDFNKQCKNLIEQVRTAISHEIGEHTGIKFTEPKWCIGMFDAIGFESRELYVTKIMKLPDNDLNIYAVIDPEEKGDEHKLVYIDVETLIHLEYRIKNNIDIDYTFID